MFRSWLGCIAGAAVSTFSVYDVHAEEGHVKCTAPIRLNIPGDSVPLALEVVLDQLDGLYAPFLLTRRSLSHPAVEKTCTHQLWKYSTFRKALHFHDTFEAPILELGESCHIMDGPVVLWTEGDKLHLQTSARHLALNLRTYSQFPPTAPLAVTAFWAFGHPRDDEMALLFVQTEEIGCSPGAPVAEREWLCLEAKVNGLDAELVPASKFIPSDYGLIATCIALHRSHVANRTANCIAFRHLFVVGTSFKQVVVFEDGRPLHVIPVLMVPTMVTASEVMGGHIAVITLDEGHNAYAHTMKPNSSRVERYAMWTGASNLLVGDFAALGHDQLLVISKSRDEKSDLESCQIVYLSEPPASSEVQQRMEDEPQKTTGSLVEALRALDVRKKAGDLYLCDLEKEYESKTELLEQGLQFLRNLQVPNSHSQNIPTPDPTLVTLLPGKFGEICKHHRMVTPGLPAERPIPHSSSTHTITLVKHWQRIIDQQWIVGVVVQSDKPLPNVSVTLVRRGGGCCVRQTCISKVMWLQEGKMVATTPRVKRLRMDASYGEEECASWKVCVASVCGGVPPLERGEAHASVVCSWSGEGDIGSVDLGTITFCIDDLLTDALTCDERCLLLWQGNHNLTVLQDRFSDKHVQDLACLLAAGIIEKVQVTSTRTPLSSLPAMLKDRLRSRVPVFHAGDTVLIPSPGSGGVGCLEGVVLYATVRPNVTLSILHKTASQLSMVLALLHHVLPEDVSITSLCEDESQRTSAALRYLEEELFAQDPEGAHEGTASVRQCTASDHAVSSLLQTTLI